eukprot:scaffold6.g2814.t1
MAPPRASPDPWGQAYRVLAKQHHPDKGGDPVVFARLQLAYETLSDPRKRQVYDTWAKELQFRYVRTGAAGAGAGLGGEDMLLDEFENLGLHCNPATQLVVTCEVCRRPATKQCWTCGMQICEFCTLKRHWRESFPLHWPLVNSDHMRERLAKRELERKRIDDMQRLALEDPNHRSEAELRDMRRFQDAAQEMAAREDRRITYDLRLARFYMWAQTPATVYVACRVPTGYANKGLTVEASPQGLLVQAEGSPPLIDRVLAGTIDSRRELETFRTQDNRVCVVALPKAALGEPWPRLFVGDSDGLRCMEPPYSMTENADDVVLELTLPFWIEAEDVRVDVGERELDVAVRNTLRVRRTYWRNADDEARRRDYAVVDPLQCMWSLDEDCDAAGERCKVLMITLVKPPLSEEEVTWKKGRRQDNRAAERRGSLHRKGWRFFADDEDDFDLEDLLQALCFREAGAVYVPPKPWQHGLEPKRVTSAALLPPSAQQFLERLQSVGKPEQ